MASPSAGAPALKYRDVNTEITSPGEVKGLILGNNYIYILIIYELNIIYFMSMGILLLF